MVQVFLSLGSNVNRAENIRLAINALQEKFGAVQCSSFYESNSVSQESDHSGKKYCNVAIGLETDMPLQGLIEELKKIEKDQGRDRSQSDLVSIDIDLLLFGGIVSLNAEQKIPHPDILKYVHVLIPLADIAGEVVHPITGKTIKELCESNLDQFCVNKAGLNKIEQLI